MNQGFGYNYQSGSGLNRRSRRIMKTSLNRRYDKPEIKKIDNLVSVSSGSDLVNPTVVKLCTPSTILQGTTASTRIGNRIRARFLKLRLQCTFFTTGTDNKTSPFRVILYHPTVDQQTAYDYMKGLSLLSHVDYDQVFVHKEFNFELTARSNNTDETGPVPWIWSGEVTIPWPRSIKFSTNSAGLGMEKDMLYVALHSNELLSSSFIAEVTVNTRLTYSDC